MRDRYPEQQPLADCVHMHAVRASSGLVYNLVVHHYRRIPSCWVRDDTLITVPFDVADLVAPVWTELRAMEGALLLGANWRRGLARVRDRLRDAENIR